MGKRRRFALQYASDDDDDADDRGIAATEAPKAAAPDSSRRHSATDNQADLELVEEGEDDKVLEETGRNGEQERREETETRRQRGRKLGCPVEEEEEESDGELHEEAEADEEEDDEDGPDAVPLGEPVEVTDEGKHYAAFEYEGNTYKLEDSAMFSPDEKDRKPYVGIIKDITEIDGSLSVTAQWFYRPEEAQKEAGDPRELFYSFHLDDVAAESVMHMCVVHFIPQHKQVPSKKEHPGFIVQHVYDHREEKLYEVTDTDYEDDNQKEIDLLIMKTMDRIGELPDCDPEDIPGDKSDNLPRRGLRKRSRKPKDVPRDAPAGRSEQMVKEDTAGNDNLKNHAILFRYKAVTGNQSRDRWLDKFVDTILALPRSGNDENSYAPNEIVSIMASLERSTFEAFHADFLKYNQKMRKLLFNIKNSSVLCKRLMNKELDPPVLLTMAPDELKAGLTPAEIGSESEEPRQLQMTEARCRRCTEKNVGIIGIIHANRGVRYKVECISCGHTSWASGGDIV